MSRPTTNGVQASSLDALLAAPVPTETVELPEFDGQALVLHAVTGLERQRLAAAADEREQNGVAGRLQFQLELIAVSLGDGATVEKVGALPATVIDRLTKAAMSLTGIEPDAIDQAEAELKATPSGDSG